MNYKVHPRQHSIALGEFYGLSWQLWPTNNISNYSQACLESTDITIFTLFILENYVDFK